MGVCMGYIACIWSIILATFDFATPKKVPSACADIEMETPFSMTTLGYIVNAVVWVGFLITATRAANLARTFMSEYVEEEKPSPSAPGTNIGGLIIGVEATSFSVDDISSS